MSEKKFVSLTCPSCNGKLKFPEEIGRFACQYCGIEHIVNRDEGIIYLTPMINQADIDVIEESDVEIIEESSSEMMSAKIASELAIPRLEKELQQAKDEVVAFDKTDILPFFMIGSIIFVLICIIFLFTADSASGKLAALILGGIGSLPFIVAKRMSDKEHKPFMDKIRYIEEELAKHRRIVK